MLDSIIPSNTPNDPTTWRRGTLAVLLCAAAAWTCTRPLQAEPSLPERIREANIWHRLSRHGKTTYLMVAQPSRSETAKAQELGVPANALDGGIIALGRPIQFTDPDDTGAVSEFGPGIKNRRMEKNALVFEVGDKDAYLAWGDFDGKHPAHGSKPFGVAYEWRRNGKWYAHTFATADPFGIYLRVRQSTPESNWKIVAGPNPDLNDVKPNAAPAGFTAEFKVTGTDWQTIPVIYHDKIKDPKGKPASFLPFGGFALYPGGPGNKVEIAWVRVTDPHNHVYARRTVSLPSAVKEAPITLSSWDVELYVNGKQAADRWVPYAGMGPRTIDLARFLKPGKNVIAVHELNNYAELMVTGGITCTDGTFVPLFSWLPMKIEGNKWVRDMAVDHFALHDDFAGPWKTASLAFKPEDAVRFMDPDYDDGDWGGLTALENSGQPTTATPYFGLLTADLLAPEKQIYQGAAPDRPRLHPIFSVREPVRLTVRGLRVGRGAVHYRIPFTLIDKQTGKQMEKGEINLAGQNAGLFRRDGLAAGAYELRLVLEDGGKRLDERAYEFLVVGPIDQPVVAGDDILDGLKLTRVVDIDCTAAPTAGAYGAFRGWDGKGAPYEARVVAAPFGKFRETGPDNADCFSYKVAIAHPRRPHVLEVTYPDDRLRTHGFFYTEMRPDPSGGTAAGTNRCSIAVLSGWPGAPSNRMKVARGLFWPVDAVGTVDVYTTRYSPKNPAMSAAAARIRIFEVDGELPQVKVNDYPGQFKPLGVHTERGGYVLWPTCYGGRNNAGDAAGHTLHERPDFYADWYSVSANYVRALRFHGLNFYFAGQHMYGGTNFPSAFNDNDNGTGGSMMQSQKDWAGILASVMAENGCGFVSSFEYINNSVVVGRGAPSERQLARGIPTLAAVTEKGKAYPYTAGITAITPLPSWAHPDVQKMLLAEVDELIDLYKEYPSWKGINFLLNTLCGPSYADVGEDPLKIGYEDAATERFEKETGIKIPVAADDPQRFSKRYAWVTGNPKMREVWVQWRCDVLLNLNRRIRDKLRAVRPDCKLYLNMAYPYRHSGSEKVEYAREPDKLRRYVMQWGWDVRAYQKEEGIVVYTMALADGEKRLVMSGQPEEMPLTRAKCLDPGYLQLFANDGKGGVDLHTIFTENWPIAQAGKWLWAGNGAWVGYHWPDGDAFNDFWTNSLIRMNPTLVAYNWHDSNLDSRMEQGLRRFARAWRPLPNGKYEILKGNGLDFNVNIQRCVEKPEYLYAANACSFKAVTVLTLPKGARVTDLNHNRPVVPAVDDTWRIDMAPYAVQSFRVEGAAGAGIVKAVTTIDPQAAADLTAKVKEELALAARLQKESGNAAAGFVAEAARLKGALDRGDYLEVETTLRGGFDYHTARNKAMARKP